jgi:hypothetical protein
MTAEEHEHARLLASVIEAAPWLDELAAETLLSGTQEERTLLVQARATAAVTEGPEVWQALLNVLGAVASAAGAVTGISGAITAVYGLKAL